jgi:pseudaminic acid biosynthesis-associated methylase
MQHWAGAFGDAYADRNAATLEAVQTRLRMLAPILARLDGDPPQDILECGCNIGLNLRALRQLTRAELHAIEPNAHARQQVLDDRVLERGRLHDATLAQLPFGDASVDLVFTSGVLIHVPPDRLERAMQEVHRVSRKYVLAVEYFSVKPEAAEYRGQTGIMWKRDFGGAYLDMFPDLVPIDVGFLWRRTTGCDDATWWLFRKRGAR